MVPRPITNLYYYIFLFYISMLQPHSALEDVAFWSVIHLSNLLHEQYKQLSWRSIDLFYFTYKYWKEKENLIQKLRQPRSKMQKSFDILICILICRKTR